MKDRILKAIPYLLEQLKQTSTWRGLILVGTALTGMKVPEEKAAAVVMVGLAIVGVIGALLPDRLTKKDE